MIVLSLEGGPVGHGRDASGQFQTAEGSRHAAVLSLETGPGANVSMFAELCLELPHCFTRLELPETSH